MFTRRNELKGNFLTTMLSRNLVAPLRHKLHGSLRSATYSKITLFKCQCKACHTRQRSVQLVSQQNCKTSCRKKLKKKNFFWKVLAMSAQKKWAPGKTTILMVFKRHQLAVHLHRRLCIPAQTSRAVPLVNDIPWLRALHSWPQPTLRPPGTGTSQHQHVILSQEDVQTMAILGSLPCRDYHLCVQGNLSGQTEWRTGLELAMKEQRVGYSQRKNFKLNRGVESDQKGVKESQVFLTGFFSNNVFWSIYPVCWWCYGSWHIIPGTPVSWAPNDVVWM